MSDTIQIRPVVPADTEVCSRICFEAFCGINKSRSFPPDFAAIDQVIGLMGFVMSNPAVHGVVAEHAGRIVGSAFLWEDGLIGGIGPVTVDPSSQAKSVGRRLMQAILDVAEEKHFAGTRLVQAAFNTVSMSLYTKLGFDVREPLLCLNGTPIGQKMPGFEVRKADQSDLPACVELCRHEHGHERTGEFKAAMTQGTARVVKQSGKITGFATDIGFFGHAVALTNHDLLALISSTEAISGPGFLLPSRNGDALRWCLSHGLRIVQPMTLMSRGLYQKPAGAFLSSITY